jgi:hypothetical protein
MACPILGSAGDVRHDVDVPGSVIYPFIPKSNRFLSPGQFWAIPLTNGRFACGRVMLVPAFGSKDRVGVQVALLEWVGDCPPSSAEIAGRPILEEARSRFDAISKTGGAVLGCRDLELDGLVPADFAGTQPGAVSRVWGWRTIANLAEEYFTDPRPGRGFPPERRTARGASGAGDG